MENITIDENVMSRIKIFTDLILDFSKDANQILDKVEYRQAQELRNKVLKIQASGYQIKSAIELEIKIDEIIKRHKEKIKND